MSQKVRVLRVQDNELLIISGMPRLFKSFKGSFSVLSKEIHNVCFLYKACYKKPSLIME